MRVFGLAGWSGSGKTTLMTQLLPALLRRGVSVSTVKHAHHDFDIDQPGKDSYRHREAGAFEVMISSDRRWALMARASGAAEPSLDDLLRRMEARSISSSPRASSARRIRSSSIHRPALGKPLLAGEDKNIVAVASPDMPIAGLAVPRFALDPEVDAIAAFIIEHCRLPVSERGAAQ